MKRSQGLRIEKGKDGTTIQTEKGDGELIRSVFSGLAELAGTIIKSRR